jgi:hypothetical protein
MKLWQKLTIDWPCALGDWLWAVLVVAPAAFLDRLTLRSAARLILQIALFAILLMYFEQIAFLHLTMLFAVDVTAYFEIATAVFILVVRGHAWHALLSTVRSIKLALQNRSKRVLRFGGRQQRNANAMRRKDGSGSSKSDDAPAAWRGGLYAFA